MSSTVDTSGSAADGILQYLRREIADGRIAPGDKLPSRSALARQFGVSPATVSMALGKLATSGLVRFVPGKGVFLSGIGENHKRGLRIGLIGWFVSNLGSRLVEADSYWQGLFRSLMAAASAEGTVIVPIPGIDRDPLDVRRIMDHHVDIVVSHGIRVEMESIIRLRSCGIPIVLGNRYHVKDGVSFVDYDNPGGFRDAVRRFVQRGHRRIGAILQKPAIIEVMDESRDAFFQELAAHGCVVSESCWCVIDPGEFQPCTQEMIQMGARRLLDRPDRPTAVYDWGENLVSSMSVVGPELGVEIGRNLAVIARDSFDDRVPCSVVVADHDALALRLLEACHTVARNPSAVVQVDVPNRFVDKGTVPWATPASADAERAKDKKEVIAESRV